jgi:predicted ribosome quality control (RQC) complex YloA/Tae2 family protein
MSNLEYSFIVKELQQLAGKHFSRIRKIDDGIYRMKIGSTEILCEPGVRLHITRIIEPAQPHDKFVEKTEKELNNAKLLSIEQINNDRIVSFNFDRASLVLEMFGHGNMILVGEDNTIAAMRYESWSDRQIKPNMPYSPPSSRLSEKLEPSEKYIIVSMMRLPLGKEYVLEALERVKISEKTPGNKLSGDQISRIEEALVSIISSASPVLFLKDGKPYDYSLARLSKYAELEAKQPVSLSAAADEYYSNLPEENPELDKLVKRLEKQKERLAELKEEEKSFREAGDYIYQHYNEVEQVLEDARAGKGKLNKKEKSVSID